MINKRFVKIIVWCYTFVQEVGDNMMKNIILENFVKNNCFFDEKNKELSKFDLIKFVFNLDKNEVCLKLIEKHIIVNHDIRFGKPIIRGTRLTVEDIVSFIKYNKNIKSLKEILIEYPSLTSESVMACIIYSLLNTSKIKLVIAVLLQTS